jgi:DNA-nicking Smr family endonuclease
MTKPPLKKPGQSAGRTISDAESALWDQVTSDVEPLAKSNTPENLPPDTPKPPAPRKQPAPRPAAPTAPAVPVAPVAPVELRHGSAPGLDRATQQKMRRGKVAIDARIDLHGMIQTEAHNALLTFLEDCQAAGRRSVLVITGKGVSGEGILRAAVPKWLNERSVRGMVRAFSHAAPKDGGEGALYVMLRRRK